MALPFLKVLPIHYGLRNKLMQFLTICINLHQNCITDSNGISVLLYQFIYIKAEMQ